MVIIIVVDKVINQRMAGRAFYLRCKECCKGGN